MIENNNNGPPPGTPFRNGEEKGEPSRRNSASSLLSSSTSSPTYDSGNISDLNLYLRFRPASISSAEDDSISIDYGEHNKFQHLLREKDQSLFLALQDVRKLKSELERRSRSEKWYKSELRLQKNSRMEILEKLYANERKFTEENQRLQKECVALYDRCSEIENQLQKEKESATKLLTKNDSKTEGGALDLVLSRDFQLEQMQDKIADQEQLIDMLRNQKQTLLKDLQKLSYEKDEFIFQLQKNSAQTDDENRTITKRCLQLVETKIVLKDELLTKEAACASMSNEVLDLQIIVKGLQEKLHAHIAELSEKEHEVNTLRSELSQNEHSDEITALLQMKHQHELTEKQQNISSLKDTISSLKTEISELEDLRFRYNDQKCEIDQIKIALRQRTSELEELRKSKQQSLNLQSNIEEQPDESDDSSLFLNEEGGQVSQQILTLQGQLSAMKHEATSQSLELNSLRKTKQDFKQLSEKYLEVCKLYEKSKFELDMRGITVEKYKFEKEKDAREIANLREKIVEVSKKLDCQKSLAVEYELALSKTQQEKSRLETEYKSNIDKNSQLKAEKNQSVQILIDKDIEIESLNSELFNMQQHLKKQHANMSQDEIGLSKSKVDSIQRQLLLQSHKVHQLNAEQNEWQNLLIAIKKKDTLIESDAISNDFGKLNQLFDEQNLELVQINELYHQETLSLKKTIQNTQNENKTFQQELQTASFLIRDLEKQIEILESVNCDYQKEIAHLAGTNERLIEEFNADLSRERDNRKKQTKQLKLEADLRVAESDKFKTEIQLLQSEVNRLNTSSQKVLNNYQIDDSVKNATQNRILQNVLETEHRRKMSRYDVHIRSLLSHVKTYKKDLEIAENRYTNLLAKSKELIKVEEFKGMETTLENMQIQFESSQREVKNLKHQLKSVNEQFYANDENKNSSGMDLTNLMDDYKKLIQQSQSAAKRPSTSAIYQLINKSNNFVPNLTNISKTVNGLREDMQQISTIINFSSPAGRSSPQRKITLMDELNLAENGTLC